MPSKLRIGLGTLGATILRMETDVFWMTGSALSVWGKAPSDFRWPRAAALSRPPPTAARHASEVRRRYDTKHRLRCRWRLDFGLVLGPRQIRPTTDRTPTVREWHRSSREQNQLRSVD